MTPIYFYFSVYANKQYALNELTTQLKRRDVMKLPNFNLFNRLRHFLLRYGIFTMTQYTLLHTRLE